MLAQKKLHKKSLFRSFVPGVSLAVWLVASNIAIAQDASQTSGGKATSVEVRNPTRRAMSRELRVPASIVADEQVDMFAKTSGYVSEVQVDIGSQVKAGDVLVRIDVPEMTDELRQAEAVVQAKKANVAALKEKANQVGRKVDIAKAQGKRHDAELDLERINLARQQELRSGNAIPEQKLDEAKIAHAIAEAQAQIGRAEIAGAEAEQQAVLADVQVADADQMVAQAKLAKLQTLMEYASIKAPFDGVITHRGVDRGAFVRSASEGMATSLLQIAKVDRLRAVLDIPEIDIPYVRVGTAVQLEVNAMGDKVLASQIVRTARALRPSTRTMRAEVDLDNRDGRLAPGMYARAAVSLETKSQALMIPSKALQGSGDEKFVFVSANGKAEVKPIHIGYDDGIWVEVLDGVSEADLVITASSGALTAGMPVTSSHSNS